jgi:catechol 2,3-dioxygenase-like lactoylglutathione lyase family enzyme
LSEGSARRFCAALAWWAFTIAFLVLPLGLIGQAAPETCLATGNTVRIDHVVVAVANLETATEAWRNLGFRLKPGRTHANGIRNAHAKFRDRTELELLSVEEPTDGLAEWYQSFISAGGGGAFLSLGAGAIGEVAETLRRAGLEPTITRGGAFDYASFPPDHPLHQIFFIEYSDPVEDAPEIMQHRNGVAGMSEVWLEVPEESVLPAVLEALGGRSCGAGRHPAGFEGRVFALANGRVILIPRSDSHTYPRVRAVTLLTTGPATDRLFSPDEAQGVWIRLAAEGGDR